MLDQDKQIVILSNCQTALQALVSNSITSKLVWEFFNVPASFVTCRPNSVHLGWVLGHVGIGGKECADK